MEHARARVGVEQGVEPAPIEACYLADAVASRGCALQQHEPLDVGIGVEALATTRALRLNRPVPPFPGAKDIGAEAGSPDHGAQGIPSDIGYTVVHQHDGTTLSIYGQPFARLNLDIMPTPSNAPDVRIEQVTPTTWVLHATQLVAVDRSVVFPFFADAANLGRITPSEMGFEIITPTPIAMSAGRVIDYHIRLYGLRLRWRTLITEWRPPFEFVDVQARGPYAEWVHRHRFTPTHDGGTLVEDEVRFRLPLGRLGTIAAPFVKRQLRRIFTYRYDAIAQAFTPPRSIAARGESAG